MISPFGLKLGIPNSYAVSVGKTPITMCYVIPSSRIRYNCTCRQYLPAVPVLQINLKGIWQFF